jgi:hypothetical protein
MKPARWQQLLLYGSIGLVFLGIGVVAGIHWGKQHRASHTAVDSSASSRQLQELPPLDSPEAALLLQNDNTPGEIVGVASA